MAFPIRSLDELSRTVRGAFRQYLPGTDASLRQNVLYVIAKVQALLGFEFEQRFAWLARQMFLSSADDDAWVARHAVDVGIWRKPASGSAGVITGTGAAGVVYSQGIRFSSGGHTWLSTAPATADGSGNVTFALACEQTGASTNRDAGAILRLTDPALNPSLGSEFEVDADGLGSGADIEGTVSLRARGLQRKRFPPRAGSLSDYEATAVAVPGVSRAWAFRVTGSPGRVLVLFLFEPRANGIPTPADVALVQAAIDSRRLIRADDGEAAAPVPKVVDVTIVGLTSDTAGTRTAIEAAIRAMFLTRCRPGIVGDTFTVSRSWISEAVSGATGEDRHQLTVPAADIVLTGGEFPVLGTVTYA